MAPFLSGALAVGRSADMASPVGKLKYLRASWADPLGRTYDFSSLRAAQPAKPKQEASPVLGMQDVLDKIMQDLWQADPLGPRAGAVSKGCSLAAKHAAKALSIQDIAAPAAIITLQPGPPLAPLGPSMAELVAHMGGRNVPGYPEKFYAFDTNLADHLIIHEDWATLLNQPQRGGWLYGHVMDAYVKTTGLAFITKPPSNAPDHEQDCPPEIYIPTCYLLTDALHFAFGELFKLFHGPLGPHAKTVSTAPACYPSTLTNCSIACPQMLHRASTIHGDLQPPAHTAPTRD